MADRFFTKPKSKKRRRTQDGTTKKSISNKESTKQDFEDEEIPSDIEEDLEGQDEEEFDLNETDSDEETTADKRRKIVHQYIDKLKSEVAEVSGFDAADLDRELIESRLQKDVAEEKGFVHKFIADSLKSSISSIEKQQEILSSPSSSITSSITTTKSEKDDQKLRFTNMKSQGVNSVATLYPYAYTVTKDLYLAKWDISDMTHPKIVRYVKGNHGRSKREGKSYIGHGDEILAVAASPDGKYVVTAGKDKKIIIWTSENLAPVRAIPLRVGNKSVSINSMVFRRRSNDLYAACSDLIVRVFNISHMAMTEQLYGHQDVVSDISALGQERCLTVGSRDRTAMLWKISEESRLTFRGGDAEKVIKQIGHEKDATLEGSIESCSMIDDTHFITGSDNGNISLWSTQRKRPLYVLREAHGKDDPLGKEEASAETVNGGMKIEIPPPIPRSITALTALPFSDIFFSGSWDGRIKIWKIENDLKSFELIGTILIPDFDQKKKKKKNTDVLRTPTAGKGVINRISVVEVESKGLKDSSYGVFAAVSREMKSGRWISIKKGKNGLLSFKLETNK